MSPRIVALIPARAGSKRVEGKNTRLLNGHPLTAYSIAAAQEAGIFTLIAVSSDSPEIKEMAFRYGAGVMFDRPAELAKDDSPDIGWVQHSIDALCAVRVSGRPLPLWDAFAIIRPTSPFRRGPWIRKAWEILQSCPRADSIRAVRPCGEHPAKMWRATEGYVLNRGNPFLAPVLTGIGYEAPWHSMPTQLLPTVYTQTAALEIAWTRVLPGSISGQMVLPYFTEADAPEALDVNTEDDWARCVELAAEHPEWLPEVRSY